MRTEDKRKLITKWNGWRSLGCSSVSHLDFRTFILSYSRFQTGLPVAPGGM